MLTLFDWSLFAFVVLGLAARAWSGMRALRALAPEQAVHARPRLWARGILSQWALVAMLVVLWIARGRGFDWLGIVFTPSPGLAGIVIGIAVMGFLLGAQRRQLATNADLVARVRARLASVEPLMPHEPREWPGFVSLAVTAGICEELLFRGFVTWVLAHVLPAFWMAALAQAVLFGLAHAYQGVRGVLTTGAVGLFMSALVWVSGGALWGAMLVHALMDLHAGDLAMRVFGTPAPERSRT